MDDERLRQIEERTIRTEERQDAYERRMRRFESHMDKLATSVDSLTEAANRLDSRFETGSKLGKWIVGVVLSIGGLGTAILSLFR